MTRGSQGCLVHIQFDVQLNSAEMPLRTIHPCQPIVIEHECAQSRQANDVKSPAQLIVTQIQHLKQHMYVSQLTSAARLLTLSEHSLAVCDMLWTTRHSKR